MTAIKWAMVGTGLMSQLILKDFALAENTELVALVSRDPERAKARLASEGIVAQALTFEQALEHPEIDVIYIGTTHATHFPLAKRALAAGKHVLLEKAFAMNAEEARALQGIALANGRFIMEAMWTKFQPLHIELKRIIESGRIGSLKLVQSSFGTNPPFDENHRLFNFEQGGGSALDQGVYTATLSHWFANSRLTKQTTVGELYPNGSDASVYSILEYENGVKAVALSSLQNTLGLSGRLVGDKGAIDFVGSFWNADEAIISGPIDGNEHPVEVVKIPRRGAGYVPMIEAVSEDILAGRFENSQHPLSFTIEIMEILDEARRQLRAAAK